MLYPLKRRKTTIIIISQRNFTVNPIIAVLRIKIINKPFFQPITEKVPPVGRHLCGRDISDLLVQLVLDAVVFLHYLLFGSLCHERYNDYRCQCAEECGEELIYREDILGALREVDACPV